MIRKKYKILFVDGCTVWGGAPVSLFNLVKGLNKNLYEPIVLLSPLNTKIISLFKNLDVSIVLFDHVEKKSSHNMASIEYLKRKGIIEIFRGRKLFSSIYGCVLFYRNILANLIPEFKQVRKIIKEKKINLVHTNNSLSGNYPAIVAGRISNVPCICHVRGFERRTYGFNRILNHCVDRFIFISKALRNAHSYRAPLLNKGNIIYNAIDFDFFDSNIDTNSVRVEFGLNQNSFLVGMIGRIQAGKGQKIFLKAMGIANQKLTKLRGVIVGKEDPGCEEYYQELRSMAISLGLGDKVFFTGWRQDIPRLISACDLIVNPSIVPEGFGRVIIEGMYMGKPVIAANGGGVPEIITDGVDGILVPPGDEKTLANAILNVCSNKNKIKAMAVRGRETVKNRFNMSRYVNEVENVYKTVLRVNNDNELVSV